MVSSQCQRFADGSLGLSVQWLRAVIAFDHDDIADSIALAQGLCLPVLGREIALQCGLIIFEFYYHGSGRAVSFISVGPAATNQETSAIVAENRDDLRLISSVCFQIGHFKMGDQ